MGNTVRASFRWTQRRRGHAGRADDTYTLDITILHATDPDFDAAEEAAITAQGYQTRVRDKLFQPQDMAAHRTTGSVKPSPESVLTYQQFKQFEALAARPHQPLTATPQQSMPAEWGAIESGHSSGAVFEPYSHDWLDFSQPPRRTGALFLCGVLDVSALKVVPAEMPADVVSVAAPCCGPATSSASARRHADRRRYASPAPAPSRLPASSFIQRLADAGRAGTQFLWIGECDAWLVAATTPRWPLRHFDVVGPSAVACMAARASTHRVRRGI